MEQENILNALLNGEWVDTEDVERCLNISFSEGMHLFDFSRTAEWNDPPLNGQKITTKFRLKNLEKEQEVLTLKTGKKAVSRRYILSSDNSFYNLTDEDERILLRSHNLGIVLQFASYLRKNGYTVNLTDSLQAEIGQGGVL